MKKTHNHTLVTGAVALVAGRITRHGIKVGTEIRDEMEQALAASDFFKDAPFTWISLIHRYGLKNDAEPSYEPIHKKDGDLPIAIEIDVHDFANADREVVKACLRAATLRALIHVAKKYGLPRERLEKLGAEREPETMNGA